MKPGDITAKKGDKFVCTGCKHVALIAARDIGFCNKIKSKDFIYPDGTPMPYMALLKCIRCDEQFNNIDTVNKLLITGPPYLTRAKTCGTCVFGSGAFGSLDCKKYNYWVSSEHVCKTWQAETEADRKKESELAEAIRMEQVRQHEEKKDRIKNWWLNPIHVQEMPDSARPLWDKDIKI